MCERSKWLSSGALNCPPVDGGALGPGLLLPCLLHVYYISSVLPEIICLIISCIFFLRSYHYQNILRTKGLSILGLSANLGQIATCTIRKTSDRESESDFYMKNPCVAIKFIFLLVLFFNHENEQILSAFLSQNFFLFLQ